MGWANKKIKNISWQDWVFITFLLLIVIIQFTSFTKLQHLAGPIYGGDIYRERGYSEHLIRGNSPLSDPLFLNEINYFPWFSHAVAASASKIFSTHIESVMIFAPLGITILAAIGFYILGKKIFNKKKYALILAIMGVSTHFYYSKITTGLGIVFSLFFLIYWFKTKESNKIKDSVIMGTYIGLAALTHGSIFINIIVFWTSLLAIELIYMLKDKKIKYKNLITRYLPGAITATLLSLIFFMPLMIRYSMKTLNNSFAYALTNIDLLSPFWALNKMMKVFFNVSSISSTLIGLISLGGLIYVLTHLRKSNTKFILALFLGTILASAHYLITKPILNKWMEPGHMLTILFIPALIFFVYGIRLAHLIFKKNKKVNKIIIGIVSIVVILALINSINSYNNSKWVQYGRSMDSSTLAMLNFGEAIKQDTGKDEVFLAHDETSFAINAVSGAKVVMSRRVHASYFVDINKRYADGMVALYGDNETQIKKLIKEYNIKYLYVDGQLIQTPMITSLDQEDYLLKNGVKYTKMNVRWDPSTTNAPSFDSLVISPQNLTIMQFVTPLTEVTAANQTMGVLYKIINI